jgi:hypothetical protein
MGHCEGYDGMLIDEIPIHLRNTVDQLNLPIFMELDGDDLRVPPGLALGDTLMVLGLVRNLGRPIRLHLKTPHLELLSAHPQIAQLVDPPQPMRDIQITSLPVKRRGRAASYGSSQTHRLKLPVLPLEQIRANPVYAHSLYYQLPSQDDRPGVYPDPGTPFELKSLLSSQKPSLVIYPFNPGRNRPYWQDAEWWAGLLSQLRTRYHLIAVGADDYGSLAGFFDALLPMSDPASRLAGLAGLCTAARSFIGIDGGLSHLACAAGARTITIWDSMSSYRFWASRAAIHLVMSNSYGFRYPQALRLTMEEMRIHYRRISLAGADGTMREIELPLDGYRKKARELFGNLDNLAARIQEMREEKEDRSGVELWMAQPGLKQAFYAQSREFVLKAVSGHVRAGQAWVTPLSP